VVLFAVLVLAVASAEIFFPSVYQAQGILQAHSPFAASSSARVQTYNGAVLGYAIY
jgi:hypothetical protein